MALTFHSSTKSITCSNCSIEIDGKHICKGVPIVKECKGSFDCEFCEAKENIRLCEAQWYEDQDGYNRCSECDLKCDGDLPKICACKSFVDVDGEEKCKRCKRFWSSQYSDAICKDCGYDGSD